jgi:Holliday junction resolvase RusA-like endonuclease
MKFIFEGCPIAKMRHRSAIHNGKICTFDEQHIAKNSHKIQLKSWIRDMKSEQEVEELKEMAHAEAFHVELNFYLPFPKKFSQTKINAILEGKEPNIANVKPDFDNVVKFYLDIGNEILYKDDKLIISCFVTKRFHTIPRTEFVITPHGGYYE